MDFKGNSTLKLIVLAKKESIGDREIFLILKLFNEGETLKRRYLNPAQT